MPDIVHRFGLALPHLDFFAGLNLACSLVASALFIVLLLFRTRLFFRLSTITGALLHIFFQWPLFIISNVVVSSLSEPYWFFSVVQVSVFSLIAFAILSDKWLRSDFQPAIIQIRPFHIIVPALLGLVLVFLYFRTVPLDCTALFAVFFDPNVALLAREVSIKFTGSYVATAAYGAFTNAVAPIVVALSIALLYLNLRRFRFFQVFLFVAIILLTVFACLISGAKGLLLPSLIVILISSLLWNKSLLMKAAAGSVSILVIFSSLLIFELVRDREWDSAHSYPFGRCSAELGACDKSNELILSLYKRAYSLGLTSERLETLRRELEIACDRRIVVEQSILAGKMKDDQLRAQPSSGDDYSSGIIYRALIVPSQVAAWHYLYVMEEENPGLSAMPFARHLSTTFVNMPERVYQKYGSEFSGGDRTSTSTSPTSFLLAYPAYLGIWGLLIAILAVILTDVITALMLKHVPNTIYPVCVGLLGVIGFNFILSDFVTVMSSHGGAMAAALMAFFAISRDRKSFKRAFDLGAALVLVAVLVLPAMGIALLVRARLGSPVLFRQQRPGLNGNIFTMFKFRTMTDAKDVQGVLLPDAERLTPFGKWLRASSLDELPELINVIRGEMSLVGPRPLLPEYLSLYTESQAQRHLVRPGVTGWAQVNGRNAIDWDTRLDMDIWYVHNQSFWLDLQILAATVAAVIRREGVTSPGSATVSKFEGSKGNRAP